MVNRSTAVFGLLVAACGSEPTIVPCTVSADCATGETCDRGACVVRPIGDRDAGIKDSGAVDAAPMDAAAPDATPYDAGCASPIAIAGGLSYCSIAEAIAAAPPGAIIDVPRGVFREALVIDTALTLRGRAGAITAETELESPDASPPITIAAANVVLESLVLRANRSTALRFEAQGTARDLTILGAETAAITVLGAGIAVLERVHVDGVGGAEGSGVAMAAGSTATIRDSRIEGTTGVGIKNEGGVLVIEGSTIYASGSYGIFLDAGAEGRIERGTRVLESNFVGIGVFMSTIDMRDSESSGSGMPGSTVEDGLWLASPVSAIVTGSIFSGNGGYGIYCSMGVDADLCSGNVYSGNSAGTTSCVSCN
jgi:nitrous oxidase accessory protein NosD